LLADSISTSKVYTPMWHRLFHLVGMQLDQSKDLSYPSAEPTNENTEDLIRNHVQHSALSVLMLA
jgi:hypothetical protein